MVGPRRPRPPKPQAIPVLPPILFAVIIRTAGKAIGPIIVPDKMVLARIAAIVVRAATATGGTAVMVAVVMAVMLAAVTVAAGTALAIPQSSANW